MVPVAGSAYTYAYATLGELFAWIIGWDLVLEYAVGSATVAHGWSRYFQDFLAVVRHRSGRWRFAQRALRFRSGHRPACASPARCSICPPSSSPASITVILVKGIQESASFNAAHGDRQAGHRALRHRRRARSTSIRPTGIRSRPTAAPASASSASTLLGQTGQGGEPLGMLAGAAIIFFAYIGFDSVSTHAEEAKNPSRDVPIGIIVSLVLCTVLYILVAGRAHRHGPLQPDRHRRAGLRRLRARSACPGRACSSPSAPSPASPRCCWS